VEVWAAISAKRRQQIKFDTDIIGTIGSITRGTFVLGALNASDTTEES